MSWQPGECCGERSDSRGGQGDCKFDYFEQISLLIRQIN